MNLRARRILFWSKIQQNSKQGGRPEREAGGEGEAKGEREGRDGEREGKEGSIQGQRVGMRVVVKY